MGKLTNQQKQMIVFILVAVLGGGYAYFNYLLKPTFQKIEASKAKYKELFDKCEAAERQARRLPQLQAEYAQLQTQLATMEKQLPTDKDIPGILRTVTREANDETLSFVSLKPNDPKRESFFEVLEFEVQLTGTFQSFVRFMSKLGQQERIFQFDRMGMVLSGGRDSGIGAPLLSITFNLKTYAYVGG